MDTSVTDPSDVKPSQLSNGNKNSSVGIRSNRKSDDDIDQVDAATNGSMTYSVVTFSGGKRIGSLIRAADVNGHYQVTDLNKNDANKPIKKIQDLLPWEKTHWNLFVTIVTSVDCVWAQIMLPEFIVSFVVKLNARRVISDSIIFFLIKDYFFSLFSRN